MWALLLGVTFGLLTSARTDSAQVHSRTCSFAGVFHVEGSNRYSLTFDQAEKLCHAIGTVLANEEQVREAHAKGLETCRYGWISTRNTTILRHQPHFNCANNQTGVLFLTEKLDQPYDAYCFDPSDTLEKNCDKQIVRVEDLPADGKEAPADEPSPDGEGAGEEVGTDAPVAAAPEEDQGAAPETTAEPEAEGEAGEQPDAAATPDPAEHAEAARDPASEEQPTEAEEQPGAAVPAEDPPSGEAVPTPDPAMEGEVQPSTTARTWRAAPPPNEASIPVGPHGRMNADVGPTAAGRESGGTPDWLIIIVVVAAIAVILLVCAAIATRNRWCGKQQTLMITSKEAGEGNGAAASSARAQERDQEMVTLMNKEKIQENGNTEEFTVITLEESPDKSQLA
ncbi:hypothetical protein ANANG_G00200840 [Anguilla anguilla]|uniref:CD44 antigen n=1 Tax=Anguilla anguilla TaxID=7936 RepID=A0A9D3RTK2_ANGAN|nr:hypothetical protein ANANG_G00200840 [Anguilla anguilla]